MSPAKRIVPANVIPIIADWPLTCGGFQNECVEDQTRTLWTERNPVLVSKGSETVHEAAAELV
jgi:hypothetical protein